MKILFSTVILIFTIPQASLSAETLNNCNGVITNRPCAPGIASLPITVSSEAQLRKTKSVLLQNLIAKHSRAKRELVVDVDIFGARQVCNDASTTVEQCRDAVVSVEKLIDREVHARVLEESAKRSSNSTGSSAFGRNPQVAITNEGLSNRRVPYYGSYGGHSDSQYGHLQGQGHGHHYGHEHDRPRGQSRRSYPGQEMSRPAIPPGSTAQLPPVPRPQRMNRN